MRQWILTTTFTGIFGVFFSTLTRAEEFKCIGPVQDAETCNEITPEYCADYAASSCFGRGGVSYYNCTTCAYYESPMKTEFATETTIFEDCPGAGKATVGTLNSRSSAAASDGDFANLRSKPGD